MATDKTAARKAAFTTRKLAHGVVDPGPAQAALLAYVRCIPALEVVSGYVPIRTEIDPMPVLDALHADGYVLCLPVVPGPDQPLEFRRWAPGEPLVAGAFGAAIPAVRDLIDPELLITPLLTFDGTGYRLGYGGGYYDRTLEALRARRRTWAVGFAYGAQQVEAVPREPTDQHLDAMVTEAGTLLPG